MSDVVIRAENLGKRYRIQHQSEEQQYETLRDVLADRAKSLFRNPRAAFRPQRSAEDFWALRDVSFEIRRGETVGIIGRNGAGKSTLLKILSRITEPTTGSVRIKGRVASLLEVGTGFHPELTGRENVYLNGAVLGMSRAEIKRKFDEIVAFAEIEKFLDTPVKRYSSGMYVRLAFAVAAHLEPEILVVDEVLAVGDAEFQKKCLGKMEDVAQHGRTVLFVSHNMQAITQLCSKAVWLNRGVASEKDDAITVVSNYLRSSKDIVTGMFNWDVGNAPGNDDFRLVAVSVKEEEGEIASAIDLQKRCYIEIEYEVFRRIRNLRVYFNLEDVWGNTVFSSTDVDSQPDCALERTNGVYMSRCQIWPNLLKPGDYTLTVGAVDHGSTYFCHVPQVLSIHVTAVNALYATDWHLREGSITPRFDWEVICR